MSRVLITGATGFVGQAVIRALRTRAHQLSGTTRNGDLRAGPEGTPLYVIPEIGPEIGPEIDWHRAVSRAEVVVHLLARTHATGDRGQRGLDAYRRVNVDGTRRLAEAAAAAGAHHFLFMSSVKAAGERSGPEGLTEAHTAAPEDAYGATKLEAEQALAGISAESGLAVTILRPPLIFGPHVRGNFRTLLRICDKRMPLPLASVNNRRSLIFVDNLAHAVATVVEADTAGCTTYFVADRPPLSTPELIRRTSAALGRQPRLFSLPPPLVGGLAAVAGRSAAAGRLLGTLVADDSAFRQRFRWTPPATLDEGLAATAKWYRDNGNGNT